MGTKKTIEQELIEGLDEVLSHKRGKGRLRGQTRELPAPAPAWSAKEVKRLREKTLHMSQTEFAALLNVKPPTVRAWEQGHNIPSGGRRSSHRGFKKRPLAGRKIDRLKRFVRCAPSARCTFQ